MGHVRKAGPRGGAIRSLLKIKLLALAVCAALCALPATAQPVLPLNTLRAVRQLTNAQAAHAYPVDFQATVTYARSSDHALFVQDGDAAIFVNWGENNMLVAGDRVEIKGTSKASFRPIVVAQSVTVLGHGALPAAVPATFDQLIHADFDCHLVTVYGVIRDAVTVTRDGVRSTMLQLHTDGGEIAVSVDGDRPDALSGLLDSEVLVTGTDSGRFDGKMEQTGVELHLSSLDDVKVLRHAAADPWSLPLTPMDQILSGYHVSNLSHRVRVHGTITYYQPGTAAVLQDDSKSLWLETSSSTPLHVGDAADATGFPDVHNGLLLLTSAEIKDLGTAEPITPQTLTWAQLSASHNIFDLVSIDGTVVAELRAASQDEYVLRADGNLFSAIYRHAPAGSEEDNQAPPMRHIAPGSKVRVTGVCFANSSSPFETHAPFNILLRTPDDLVLLASAPWITIGNLVRLVAVLLLAILLMSIWGWTLRRRVRKQTEDITRQSESDAAQERRVAQLEQWRSRILEDINSSRPLSDIVEHVTEMVSFMLNGAPCWCEVVDGPLLGRPPANREGLRLIHQDVPSRTGLVLATLYAAPQTALPNEAEETEALTAGVRLATLSIETRKLYSDLIHRSEFDLLTDMYNRFSLDRHLQELIERARENSTTFGLIYVDLDDFKLVNDLYGHRVGDLYLQEAALRMKRQLRTGDVLGRLGGDEFAALVSVARGPADVEEIAQRLERCFDAPFAIDGYVLRGSASVGMAIYPTDGTTSDSLLTAADAAMYLAKNNRRAQGHSVARR
ncbi:MAG TPA: GGDEF domain-containing protein [Terracidiphilus sp.]|nr:GGDEF domain-containing protein [Terracidiphilus sp.]